MTKPRLEKVRALFCVLQQVIKRGYAYFDTASRHNKRNCLYDLIIIVYLHIAIYDCIAETGPIWAHARIVFIAYFYVHKCSFLA